MTTLQVAAAALLLLVLLYIVARRDELSPFVSISSSALLVGLIIFVLVGPGVIIGAFMDMLGATTGSPEADSAS